MIISKFSRKVEATTCPGVAGAGARNDRFLWVKAIVYRFCFAAGSGFQPVGPLRVQVMEDRRKQFRPVWKYFRVARTATASISKSTAAVAAARRSQRYLIRHHSIWVGRRR
jgi:hypothetical protein